MEEVIISPIEFSKGDIVLYKTLDETFLPHRVISNDLRTITGEKEVKIEEMNPSTTKQKKFYTKITHEKRGKIIHRFPIQINYIVRLTGIDYKVAAVSLIHKGAVNRLKIYPIKIKLSALLGGVNSFSDVNYSNLLDLINEGKAEIIPTVNE